MAGYGMGGNSNLPAFEEVAWQVNVDGTQNVIDACLECNVEALGKKSIGDSSLNHRFHINACNFSVHKYSKCRVQRQRNPKW